MVGERHNRRQFLKRGAVGLGAVNGRLPFVLNAQSATQSQETVPAALKQAIDTYRTENETAVGVLPPMHYGDTVYRIAIYLGPVPDRSWSGIRSKPSLAEYILNTHITTGTDQQFWDRFNTQKVLVFAKESQCYRLVTAPDVVYEVASLATPGAAIFLTAGEVNHNLVDYSDSLAPNNDQVQNINEVVNSEVFIATGDKSWINTRSDQDKYLTALRAMVDTKTQPVLPAGLRQQLTAAQTVADVTTVVGDTVSARRSPAVTTAAETYASLVQEFNRVKGLDQFTDIVPLLDVLLRIAEYQTYASRRVAMIDRLLTWEAEGSTTANMDSPLKAAMRTVRDEHQDIQQQFLNNLTEFVEQKVEAGAIDLSETAGKTLFKQFGRYVAGNYASSAVVSAIAGAGNMFMHGLVLSKYLYETGTIYESGVKAKYAYSIGTQIDRIADAIRRANYGTPGSTDQATVANYRAADFLEFRAYGTYWLATATILDTRAADIKDLLSALTGNQSLDQKQQSYVDLGQTAHRRAQQLYYPATLDRVVEHAAETSPRAACPPSEEPAGSGPDAWRTFRGNPVNTGRERGAAGPGTDLTEVWSFATDDAVRSSPTVVDGTVYVGSHDGNVYAVDAADGTERWQFSTGGNVVSSPAVVDNTVFVGSEDHHVYALNAADGTEQWRFDAGAKVRSSPAVVDGTVYIGSRNLERTVGRDGIVYALDAADGTEQWRYTAGTHVLSSPTVVNDVVYVGSNGAGAGGVYALAADDGRLHWHYNTGYGNVSNTPAVVDNTVYFGDNVRQRGPGRLLAVDADTGDQLWETSIGRPGMSSPAVTGGTVYLYAGAAKASEPQVVAADATSGPVQWQFTPGVTATYFGSSPAVADDIVYFGSPDGTLYALDAGSGTTAGSITTAGAIHSSPTVVDTRLYVGSDDGHVYAIE